MVGHVLEGLETKTMRKNNVNWREEELTNWIGSDQRPLKRASRKTYKMAYIAYSFFTRITAKQLIDEAEAEAKASQRQRGTVKRRLLHFREWLLNDYVSGRGGRAKVHGITETTANAYLGAIRGFYRDNGFPVQFARTDIKKVRPTTQRKMLRVEDVNKLLNKVYTQRDKAIIICMYQSGMDISTLLSLRYAHIKEGLEEIEEARRLRIRHSGRIMLRVTRPKTRWRYRTFLGKDAVVYLKNYLLERKGKLRLDSPIFMTWKTKRPKPVRANEIMAMFRRLAVRAGFVTKEELETFYTINPVGSHALRASFSKIATSCGINKDLIDYMMGHETSFSGAYSNLEDEDLEKNYDDLEPHLTVSTSIVSAEDRLRDQAKLWGINLDDIIQREARKLYESGAGASGGEFPNFEDPEVMASVLRDEIKRLLSNNGSPREQRIVNEEDLPSLLSEGWRYVNSLNNGSGKCIIQRA